MAKKYARGMHAWGICGRSGRKMLLRDMVFDGRYPNMRVDPAWYEARHPQETLPRVEDPIALYAPSPEVVAPPTVPVVTLAILTPTSLSVTWTPAESGITNMEEYQISRSVNGGAYAPYETCVLQKDFLGGIIGITNATFPIQPELPNDPWANVPPDQSATFIDTEVVLGSTYCYMVEAVPQGNNQYVAQGPPITSQPVCILVAIPAPVLVGRYDFTADAVDLSWSMAPTWEAAVENWELYKEVNGGGFTLLTTLSPGTLNYTDTAASNINDQYSYYVIGTFGSGPSPDSNTVVEPKTQMIVYTTSGAFTKANYPNIQKAAVTAMGGGGGGPGGWATGGGRQPGPGGGAGGGYGFGIFSAADIPDVVSVTVGIGGSGGPSLTQSGPGDQYMTDGTGGTTSSFGTLVVATGGAPTIYNSSSAPAGGVGTVAEFATGAVTEQGGAGAANGLGNSSDTPRPGGSTTNAPAGGGGGTGATGDGQIDPSAYQNPGGSVANGAAGGVGGASTIYNPPGGANIEPPPILGFPGQPGQSAPTSPLIGGSGGGSGGAAFNYGNGSGPIPADAGAIAGAGAAGGFPGGGGGGGGEADVNTYGNFFTGGQSTGGAGGAGAQGVVVVVVYS